MKQRFISAIIMAIIFIPLLIIGKLPNFYDLLEHDTPVTKIYTSVSKIMTGIEGENIQKIVLSQSRNSGTQGSTIMDGKFT